MIIVPLDFRWVMRGRVSLLGVLTSSVSVEAFEVDWEAGGVGRVSEDMGSDSVIEGTKEA